MLKNDLTALTLMCIAWHLNRNHLNIFFSVFNSQSMYLCNGEIIFIKRKEGTAKIGKTRNFVILFEERMPFT